MSETWLLTWEHKQSYLVFFHVLVQAKQLGAREADLQKQDAFYREQVARLEERVSLHLEHASAGHITV